MTDQIKQIPDPEVEITIKYLKQTLEIDGDVVELGCYAGETSLQLAKVLKGTNKRLWLYDSFQGLPYKSRYDESALGQVFTSGELSTSKSALLRRFKSTGQALPIVKKAWFSDLSSDDLPNSICFALLDGDYYESIRDSLKLIENKMTTGGIVVVHDYQNDFLPGVRVAVDEWLAKNPRKLRIERSLAIIFY